MWKSWLKHLFASSGGQHPLDRKTLPVDHDLGQIIGLVIVFSTQEVRRLKQDTIYSDHILLALAKYPTGLAHQALIELGITAEKVEALLPERASQIDPLPDDLKQPLELETIFQKAQDEARYFKRNQVAFEHILLALIHFEAFPAYSILQQLNITPKLLREKVYDLVAKEVVLDGPPSRTDPQKIERFTKRARHVLSISQQIAEQRHDRIIGVEYLMIALIREDGGVAARSLQELGVTSEKLEAILYLRMKRVPDENKLLELSPQVKRTLEFAVDEARRRGHHYIGTEHLLLGLTRQRDLLPMQALEQLGITMQMVQAKVRAILASPPSA